MRSRPLRLEKMKRDEDGKVAIGYVIKAVEETSNFDLSVMRNYWRVWVGNDIL